MTKNILIAYATRAGSTMEIADSVGKILAESGVGVEVMPVKAVGRVADYSAVVLGSAVRMGSIMPELMKFVKTHKTELQKMPVAAFAVCMSMKDDTPEKRKESESYLDGLRKEVPLVSEGFFAGRMDYKKLNFFVRFMIKNMIKTPEGDFRDWKKIREWAEKVGSSLKS